MPSEEEIKIQQELLTIHRRTLIVLLKERAQITEPFVPPALAISIQDARVQIRLHKKILRDWGVTINDDPNDEELPSSLPGLIVTKPPGPTYPLRKIWKTIKVWLVLFIIALICLGIVIIPIWRYQRISSQPFQYCTAIVASSRPLTPNGSGDECWLQLLKGDPTELTFNEPAQITFGTSTGGDDSFFFNAKKGDKLSNVTGATIRPTPHIKSKYGSLGNLKSYEIAYHSGRKACLRDANDGDKPLTAFCNQ